MALSMEKTKQIRLLIRQVKSLKQAIINTLNNTSVSDIGRYVSYKAYAERYNEIAKSISDFLDFDANISFFNINNLKGQFDTTWTQQKEILEMVAIYTDEILNIIEMEEEFSEDEFENISNFIKGKLRTIIFQQPTLEKEVQNSIETLFVGKNMVKGIDYDRETGKFEFSGKEYIPDFIIPKLEVAIEVKLLKEGKRSRIIDEINADIVAYSTHYRRLLFIVYDLGVIRDETEFVRDIENSGEAIKVLIIKH